MNDLFLKWMKRLWKWDQAIAILLGIVILSFTLEAAQSGFLGDTAYRGSARFVPWQP